MTDIKNEEVASEKKSLNFIEQAVEKDLKEGKNGGKVQTRFPPEPNGYLHIGHAKAICLDFGIAEKHGGVCNLRFDDTNPTKEDVEYVEAIKEDIQWLGYQWGNEYYASDYFQQLWDFAIRLIQEGKAYIDEQSSEQIAQQKGTPTQPGVESPYRNRPIEESLELFKKMNIFCGQSQARQIHQASRVNMDKGFCNHDKTASGSLMEALYNPHQDGFASPQWNSASCEKPLIPLAYFDALSPHKYNPSGYLHY